MFLTILVCPTESFKNYSPATSLRYILRQAVIRTLCYYTCIGLLHILISFLIFSLKQSTERTEKRETRSIISLCNMHFATWNLLVLASFPPCCAYLLVLVGRHGYKLGLWEGMAGDHPLWATHSHYMNPWLILVQGVQHDLWANRQSR